MARILKRTTVEEVFDETDDLNDGCELGVDADDGVESDEGAHEAPERIEPARSTKKSAQQRR